MGIALISLGILVSSAVVGGLVYLIIRFATARMWRTPIEALIDLDNDEKRLSSFGFDAVRLSAPAVEQASVMIEAEPEAGREDARPMEHAA